MPALEIFLIAMRLQTQLDQARATAMPVSWRVAVTVCSFDHYMTLPAAGDLGIGGIVRKYGIRKTIDFTYCVLDKLERG